MKLTIALVLALAGCSTTPEPGPTKDRLRELLSQCRQANRERVRIIKGYEAANCSKNPSQEFGSINFDEAGN